MPPESPTPRVFSRPFQKWMRWTNVGRIEKMARHFEDWLEPNQRIVDIGAGPCLMSELFADRGHQVTPLDVRNLSCARELDSVVYDGRSMPFDDNAFDVGLIQFVLHHIADQDQVLREALRVAPRLIVGEDLIHGGLQTWFTYAWDSILNSEYIGHPHSNRSEAGWRAKFDELGCDMVNIRYCRWGGLSQAMFDVRRRG